jgi:hypothetical protein
VARELTPAEARVIAVLLGTGGEPEKARLERSEAPRSTYITARRRAYDNGWVRDRFLPSPAVGYRYAHWVLVRPFLEHRAEVEARFSEDPGTVLIWRWPEHLLSLRFEGGPLGSERSDRPLVPPELGRPILDLRSDLARPHVPVYFDFEGAWANFVDVPRGRGYPRALGSGEKGRSETSEGLRRSVGALVARPFGATPEPGTVFRRFVGAGGLARSQRRLLQKGWVSWRVLPDLKALPAYAGRRAQRLVLLEGRLRSPDGLKEMFHDLWALSRTAPFLLASDGSKALLGFVGLGERLKGGTRLPSPRSRPVGTTLQEHLSDIQTFSIPVDELEVPMDHRYDRLFSHA